MSATLMAVTTTHLPMSSTDQRREEFERAAAATTEVIAEVAPSALRESTGATAAALTLGESSRTATSRTVVVETTPEVHARILQRLQAALPSWRVTGHWPIRTVLAITHGYPVQRDPYLHLLTAMTGQPMDLVTGIRAQRTCQAAILAQHPLLTVITPAPEWDEATGDYRDTDQWADRVETLIGPTLPIAPLAPGEWERRDLIEEVLDHAPPETVWVLPGSLQQDGPTTP